MKMHDAKQIVAKLGMTISKTDNEYRITFTRDAQGYASADAREAVAYYTDDINDAVGTARMMYAHHSRIVSLAHSNASLRTFKESK